jgi:hypothetical protein
MISVEEVNLQNATDQQFNQEDPIVTLLLVERLSDQVAAGHGLLPSDQSLGFNFIVRI